MNDAYAHTMQVQLCKPNTLSVTQPSAKEGTSDRAATRESSRDPTKKPQNRLEGQSWEKCSSKGQLVHNM